MKGAPRPAPGRLVRIVRRTLRASAWTVATLAIVWCVFAWWVERAGLYEARPLPADRPEWTMRPQDDGGGVSRLGAAWMHADEGIAELYVEGDAIARGYAAASLAAQSMELQEDQLMQELDRLLPPGVRRHAVRKGLLFAFRSLPDFIGDDQTLEASAMARALGLRPRRPMDDEFPTYHRVLFYQSLYDVGQSMAEAGLVQTEVGCTSFAAAGPATAAGGLVVGRNCDFEAGAVFDERKIVHFVRPDAGHAFVAVSWGGMIGVVSGVNDRGLVVMLHAARTEASKWPRVGRPVPLILREALVHDETIEQVAARFRASPQHAAAIVLVAESATGRAATVETDPVRTVVVPAVDGVAICANHMTSPEWDGDPVVRAHRAEGSSMLRERRMHELVGAARGALDGRAAAAFLRDRRGLGGIDVGMGNRTTIAALIAAHTVVYEAATQRLHVARAPRGTGEFVTYDLGRFFRGGRPQGPTDVRCDGITLAPAADTEAASKVDRARALLRRSDALRRDGGLAEALTCADAAVELMSRSPEALLARAESLLRLGRADEAAASAVEALGRQPVPGVEAARLTELAAPRAR